MLGAEFKFDGILLLGRFLAPPVGEFMTPPPSPSFMYPGQKISMFKFHKAISYKI